MTERLLLLLYLSLLTACADLRFSPYQTNIDPDLENSNGRNLKALESRAFEYPFRIALMGDTHNYYDSQDAVIGRINSDDEVDLVIQVGDMTNLGLLEEYEWTYSIFSKIDQPFLAVIGNHDATSYGQDIYRDLFGSYNFAFEHGEIHFIFFNNNDLEFRPAPIDYPWLERQLLYRRGELIKIVVSHIPPWADRSFRSTGEFEEMLAEYGVDISLHGHTARGFERHAAGPVFIGAGDVRSRRYGYLDLDLALEDPEGLEEPDSRGSRSAIYREFGGDAQEYLIELERQAQR